MPNVSKFAPGEMQMSGMKLGMAIAGFALVTGMATLSVTSHAQDGFGGATRPAQDAAPGGGRQRQGGGQGFNGGGGTTMIAAGQYLYILRGNQLLKLDADTLNIIKEKTLPSPAPRNPDAGGAPAGAPGRDN